MYDYKPYNVYYPIRIAITKDEFRKSNLLFIDQCIKQAPSYLIKELLIDDKTYLNYFFINSQEKDTSASEQLKNVKEDLTFDRLLQSFRARKDKTVYVQLLFTYSTNKYTRKYYPS